MRSECAVLSSDDGEGALRHLDEDVEDECRHKVVDVDLVAVFTFRSLQEGALKVVDDIFPQFLVLLILLV